MDWKTAKVPSGGKLFKIQNFNFIFNGTNFNLEIDEYADGTFTGHGEHSTDQNYVIESVSSDTLAGCIDALLGKIVSRNP